MDSARPAPQPLMPARAAAIERGRGREERRRRIDLAFSGGVACRGGRRPAQVGSQDRGLHAPCEQPGGAAEAEADSSSFVDQ